MWGTWWAEAVVAFAIGSDEAWTLTPQEWRMLYRAKVRGNKTGGTDWPTTEESAEMQAELDEWVAEELTERAEAEARAALAKAKG